MPRLMSADDWPPATFTAPLRGDMLGQTLAERLQKTAAHEASIAFRVTKAVSRVPILGRLIGAPREAPGQWKPLADRTTEVERIRRAPLYRRIEALRSSDLYERLWRRRVRGDEAPAAAAAPPAPAPDRQLVRVESRYVDEALEYLRRVPFQELQQRGWHLQPNHYYWPLNDVRFLREHEHLWHNRPLPPGIDWDLDGQVAFARELASVYHELDDVEREGSRNALGGGRLTFDNGSFSGADACAYYGVVRTRQPRRVVEIGGGWSTIFLAHALARNEQPAAVTLIEPEPDARLLARLPRDWDVQKSLLQFADLAAFERLEAGDVCFYDGSHVARTGSDVNWFFFEVLPRLAPGVLIHVHDIYWPDDYHDQWIYGDGISWNEQYLLQAFLMHNQAYRVRLANHLLRRLREDDVRDIYPAWADGGSVWLEKTATTTP
jgi:predicted O-methyltransferase YrrM